MSVLGLNIEALMSVNLVMREFFGELQGLSQLRGVMNFQCRVHTAEGGALVGDS